MYILDFLQGHKKNFSYYQMMKKQKTKTKQKIPDLKRVILVISFPT